MYTKVALQQRRETCETSIERQHLLESVLRMLYGYPGVRLNRIHLPTKPPQAALENALRRLLLLGCITRDLQLTPGGKEVLDMRCQPMLAMIVPKGMA